MSVESLFPLLSALLTFSLGFFIFARGQKNRLNRTFSLFAFVVTIWMFGTFMMFLNKDDVAQVVFWDRFVYMGVVFIPAVMLHFGLALTENYSKEGRNVLILCYLLSAIFLIIVPTNYFVDGAFIYKWGAHSRAKMFHHLFLLYFSVLIIAWFFIVYKKYYSTKFLYEKVKIKYCLFAFYILAIFGSLGYLPAYGVGIYPFSYISGVVFVVIIFYAVVKHRLMDIKMVLRSSSVYLLSLLSIIILAVCANFISFRYFSAYIYWTNLIILIFSISIFPSVKNKYFIWANKYFFSSLYDPQKLIAGLSGHLRTTLQIISIYSYIFESLDKAFHFKSFGILSYNENSNIYNLDFNKGLDVKKQTKFFNNLQLYEMFISQNKIMVTEELQKNFYDEKNKDIIDLLVELKVEILVPLNVKNRIVGLIALGPKDSNDMYNDVDLQTLEIISAQAATAIENAHLYEKTLNFNLKLKEEVERATRDLVAANKKLIKLDEAKSEFISIASHQLRTPLTIIKGYISMILEGNFGELTPGEKDSLEKVYSSNERLIQLVENLLNISRIESGRLQFDYRVMQLEEIVDSVVEELEPKAKGKGLKFTYKKSKKKLPAVNIDEEKIRQVVMNLADNAIKYTKKGSVTVSLQLVKSSDPKIGECLEFKVMDSGMGITPEDLPNLFKKFSRGTGSSLVHTEGTGLGLYVARQMIEAHNGKIWAESAGENKGSKFCFRISIKNNKAKKISSPATPAIVVLKK